MFYLATVKSAIYLGKNSSYHSRTKHIDVRYHWIRDVVSSKLLKLEKIHTDDNRSDMMTKILPSEKLRVCCKATGMAVPPHMGQMGEDVGYPPHVGCEEMA